MKGIGESLKFLYKMERKFGRYAIHNLMYYIIVLSVLGIVLSYINPVFVGYLMLSPSMILQGQVWRLVTWIIVPYQSTQGVNLIFTAIELYLYYFIGKSLENSWGAFRFNLYYIAGILFNILAAFIVYFAYKSFGMQEFVYPYGLRYINQSLFLAFATLYPNMQLMYMFIIPLKIKYLAYVYAALIGYDIFNFVSYKQYGLAFMVLIAVANFLIFFLATRNYKKVSPKEYKRKAKYRKNLHLVQGSTRHKCAVCGRTELDGDELEFRFCSKCEGNYEYCMEHLFTHEHVHKN